MSAALDARIAAVDWRGVEAQLEHAGFASTGPLLEPGEAGALAALYGQAGGFRARVVMARHGFGQGEYRYFAYPLPPLVQQLRAGLYARLVPLANRWRAALGGEGFPATHAALLARCHGTGQVRPTPLLLRYGPGDYNRLHQDLYGEHVFPLQVVFLLSPPQAFEGGEFVFTEQRPRMQSRASVLPMAQGHGLIFAVSERPVPGLRGVARVQHRHGLSTVRQGVRHALGVVFHDAR